MNTLSQPNYRLYTEARQDYETNWVLVDQVLYQLCRNYPHHKTRAIIKGKLSLIGRSYATGLERHGLVDAQTNALEAMGEHLYKHRARVDALVAHIRGWSEPLTVEKLEDIATKHGDYVKLLSGGTNDGHSLTSFASKYLHFHCVITPIYDSVASKGLKRCGRWNKKFAPFAKTSAMDDNYYWFIIRFYRVYEALREKDSSVTVRFVDRYLLRMANQSSAARS